jgi:hypothetical protein
MSDDPNPCLPVAHRLVELCRAGAFREAMESLYADDIASVEVMGDETMPREINGLDAVRRKTDWWEANHELHGCEVLGPFPHGDRFVVVFTLDLTPKVGPMAGTRHTMQEAGLYTCRDGKVVREEFFYDLAGPAD